MSRLNGKLCPFFNKECQQNQCALFEERLDNCAFQVLIYNLYKLEKTIGGGPAMVPPGKQPTFPVPPRT
ncbi:hypothetical protein HRM2_19310 [Desulforapulum autotrophicum HRM2]|uniref:Uncharacterized protein n=1 Tax=Desulforapulum autotrophicum (strain ATCC 43914 / DSM 3382 / VKM B-1955 / HRM2) TaxID=177437 RepID=C0QC20_DESAH|nr:hypothetical protein HRM2_19310 [Desulforapulum autotrophicum HRM2]